MAVAIVGAIIWASGPRDLARAAHVGVAPAVQVLAMTGLLALASSWRWRLVLARFDPAGAYPLFSIFRVVIVGLVLGLVVSQDVGSASSRIAYLTRDRRMPLAQAGYSVLLDRWLDLLVLAALAPVSALFLARVLGAGVALALLGLAAGALLALSFLWPSSLTWLLSTGYSAASVALRHLLRRQGRALQPVTATMRLGRRQLALAVALSLARLVAVTLRAWLVALALGTGISMEETFLLVPIVQVALLVPLTPGGLGVYDAGWYGALLSRGVAGADALAFVLLHRVLSTAALLAIAALTEAAWHLGRLVRRPAAGTGGDGP